MHTLKLLGTAAPYTIWEVGWLAHQSEGNAIGFRESCRVRGLFPQHVQGSEHPSDACWQVLGQTSEGRGG